MKIRVTADSTCDLPESVVKEMDIRVVPLYISRGDEMLRDGVDIEPAGIFDYVNSGAGMCATAAANVADYVEVFREELKNYDAVIHVNISSFFSSCYQNACIAAKEFENVYVVDSYNLSTGMGHLVMDARLLADQGMEPAAIAEELRERAKKVEASFVIDSLKYLAKGGRCSSLTALGANLLKLKPCIEVIDGKMEVGKKYRGNFTKVIAQYVEDRLKGRDDIDYRRIYITYANRTPDEAVEAAEEMVRKCGQFDEIIRSYAGCTVSCHCGEVCLGVLFFRK